MAAGVYDPDVSASQQHWLHIRRSIDAHHLRLAQTPAQLYPQSLRVGNTGLIARPDWLWQQPVDLSNITLSLNPTDEPAAVDGTEDHSAHLRPLRVPGIRYHRYSQAIRDVAQPRLFENCPCWRLLQADIKPATGHLHFGLMNCFDAIDTCEAVAPELAATHLVNNGQLTSPSWRGLQLRMAIGDPFDLRVRRVSMAINTLTIRRDRTGSSVVLHNRSAASVATSGGVISVMPAGVFQPSTVRAADHKSDFDLWRNIMREYSEEFLGNLEHDGDGQGISYDTEPFATLDAARRAGSIRAYALGLALGALNLWAELETVVVIDADVFDAIFANLVKVNDEGTVLRIGRVRPTVHVPFTRHIIDELLATGRLAPVAAFSLDKAWTHRDLLLG